MEIEPHSPWTSSTMLSSLACDSSLFGLVAIPLAPRLLGKVILIFKGKEKENISLRVHVSLHHNANMCINKLKITTYTMLRLLSACYSLLRPLISFFISYVS